MTERRRLVLLGGVQDWPGSWGPVRQELAGAFAVLTPDLGVQAAAGDASEEEHFDLGAAAGEVAAALEAEVGAPAVVCGVGLGAMVGLRLAADRPERVEQLVLLTRRLALNPLLMSLPAVVLRLLPATAVQRLGAQRAQVVALLDQVRPVDAVPLAKRVRTPATVLCGARDANNRRPSEALAGALPVGRLQLVAQAGPDWLTEKPHLLTQQLLALATPDG